MSKKKKKKEKITYVDDGSTVSDMSNVGGIGRKIPSPDKSKAPRRDSTFREKFATYWSAVKTMFLPMLAVLVALSLIFLVLFIIAYSNGW
ncbi:MAG: hypothetical protein ILP02_04000 [Clostridia bacterium]|nr:hypothetical protein [Clostridia bacterium]